jgi:hypothetical protein
VHREPLEIALCSQECHIPFPLVAEDETLADPNLPQVKPVNKQIHEIGRPGGSQSLIKRKRDYQLDA